MDIFWLGHSCFQLRGKNVTLITDPFSPQQSGHPQNSSGEGVEVPPANTRPYAKITASIVTISHEHPGHNYAQGVSGNPRVVRGPGEYEISDVLITGIASYHDAKRGQERGRNTIYVIHMDDLVICHLGDLGHTLQEEQLEEVADADILLIPIGAPSINRGASTLNAAQAAEVISQVEPRIVIPMHYHIVAAETANPLDKFCREMGVEAVNAQPKLTVTRSNLPAETQVVVLLPRG